MTVANPEAYDPDAPPEPEQQPMVVDGGDPGVLVYDDQSPDAFEEDESP